MRVVALCGLVVLGGCGGETSGTNYSDPPPMAEIVATPSPVASATPEVDAAANTADQPAEPAANETEEANVAVE